MAAGTLIASSFTATGGTTIGAAVITGMAAGDLLVVQAMGGDSAPTIAIATIGTVTFDTASDGSTTGSSITLGDGTSSTLVYLGRKADAGNSLYVHTWATRVRTLSGSVQVSFTASTWSTNAARRFGYSVYRAPTGYSFPAPA